MRPASMGGFELVRLRAWLAHHHPDVPFDALCAAIPLDPAVGPDDVVPIVPALRLWGEITRATDRTFPVRFGLDTRPEALGRVGVALLASPDARQALARLARFQHLLGNTGVTVLEEQGAEAWIRWQRRHPPAPFVALGDETVVASQIGAWRALVPAPVREIRFAHPAPEAAGAIEARLGAPVAWGAGVNAFRVDAEALAVPTFGGHPALAAFVDQHLSTAGPASVAERVRAELEAALDRGEVPSAEAVARRLARSERTLRRALAAEGASFRGVLDEVRRARARVLLADRGTTLGEVAFALGFTDLSSFGRARRRWTGRPGPEVDR